MEKAGWWMAERDDFKRRYWTGVEIHDASHIGPGLKSQPDANLFFH
jgi:hypothetical protein